MGNDGYRALIHHDIIHPCQSICGAYRSIIRNDERDAVSPSIVIGMIRAWGKALLAVSELPKIVVGIAAGIGEVNYIRTASKGINGTESGMEPGINNNIGGGGSARTAVTVGEGDGIIAGGGNGDALGGASIIPGVKTARVGGEDDAVSLA